MLKKSFVVAGVFILSACTNSAPDITSSRTESTLTVPTKTSLPNAIISIAPTAAVPLPSNINTPLQSTTTSLPTARVSILPTTSLPPQTVLDSPSQSAQYKDYSSSLLASLVGQQPVVLFFYAAWCPTCRQMETEITRELSTFPPETVILKINYDTETALKQKYDIRTQSSIVILDRAGNVAYSGQDPGNKKLITELSKVR